MNLLHDGISWEEVSTKSVFTICEVENLAEKFSYQAGIMKI